MDAAYVGYGPRRCVVVGASIRSSGGSGRPGDAHGFAMVQRRLSSVGVDRSDDTCERSSGYNRLRASVCGWRAHQLA